MNVLEKSDTWKIQLTRTIKIVSSTKSDDIEIMINDQTDKVIEELFQSLLSRYQNALEILMRSSDFVLDCVH